MTRGKVPSLLSANNGGISYDTTQRRGDCSRCKETLSAGMKVGLLKVQQAGFSNKKRLCLACVKAIVNKTQEELNIITEGATLDS